MFDVPNFNLNHMKRILLLLTILSTSLWASAQIIVSGVSPATIEGNYDFTWADPGGGDWACPDFNTPGVFVEAEVMLVDDGYMGTNPQGNPISAEGCLPLVNDLTGKIALVYRNTCEFGMKALNAQNAGAVGVIIINRDPEVLEMGGGAEGLNVTIPTVMLQLSDGQALINEAANGPTVVFMGNRAGIYDNDLNLRASRMLIAKNGGVPSQLAQDDTEFNFDIGASVFNLGQANADSVYLRAYITDPSSSIVYDELRGPFSLSAVVGNTIDSLNVLSGGIDSFPTFSLPTYDEGAYSLTYETYNGALEDDYDSDNEISSDFLVNDEMFAYAAVDAAEVMPNANQFFRAANAIAFTSCVHFQDPNASRLAAEGITFASSNNLVELVDELVGIEVYEWNDEFVDLVDPNAGAFSALNPIYNGTYVYTENLQDENIYVEFTDGQGTIAPIYLQDDVRYLFCTQTFNENLFFGFDTRTDYIQNQDNYLQPITVISADGAWNQVAFGADVTSAIAINIIDTGDVVIPVDTTDTNDVEPDGIGNTNSLNTFVYPNPTRDIVNINADASGIAELTISDITGKTVRQGQITLNNGKSTVNVSDLENGLYIFNVRLESGETSKFNIIKQ